MRRSRTNRTQHPRPFDRSVLVSSKEAERDETSLVERRTTRLLHSFRSLSAHKTLALAWHSLSAHKTDCDLVSRTAGGGRIYIAAERVPRKLPRYSWHLGCILLKMPAISLRTGHVPDLDRLGDHGAIHRIGDAFGYWSEQMTSKCVGVLISLPCESRMPLLLTVSGGGLLCCGLASSCLIMPALPPQPAAVALHRLPARGPRPEGSRGRRLRQLTQPRPQVHAANGVGAAHQRGWDAALAL